MRRRYHVVMMHIWLVVFDLLWQIGLGLKKVANFALNIAGGHSAWLQLEGADPAVYDDDGEF